ncbi:hypothetical protein QYF36_026022 [Acer negundo]|nr:hypothetical protein QYF36_026022 [Acer negundo]
MEPLDDRDFEVVALEESPLVEILEKEEEENEKGFGLKIGLKGEGDEGVKGVVEEETELLLLSPKWVLALKPIGSQIKRHVALTVDLGGARNSRRFHGEGLLAVLIVMLV